MKTCSGEGLDIWERLYIDISIKTGGGGIPEWVHERFLMDDLVGREFKSRVIWTIPTSWAGFRDGFVVKLLREFNERMFVALAFFSDDSYGVKGLTDSTLDVFRDTFEGVKVKKYVKKNLIIVKTLGNGNKIVKGLLLNMKFYDPVVVAFDLFVNKEYGGMLNLSKIVGEVTG